MAKRSQKITASWPLDMLYWSVDDMPWDAIEDVAGREFTSAERDEVFICTQGYSIMYGKISDSAPKRKVDELRGRLLRHTDALIELADYYRPSEGPYPVSETEESVFFALQAIAGPDGFNLTESLRRAAESLRELQSGLSVTRTEDEDDMKTQEDPEAVGLAGFVAYCLDGADKRPAKTSPGYLEEPSAVEYHRWGLHLSAQRGDLADFASAVFNREVSQGQVQHAFKVMREKNLFANGEANLGVKLMRRPKVAGEEPDRQE